MVNTSDKILVTGGHGFLGTSLLQELALCGYTNVIAPRHTIYNLLSMDAVNWLFFVHKPDVVIHLAASVGGIGANQDNPGRFFYENMQMGLNVMELARKSNCKKFINIGTVCAYPKIPKTIPFIEEELWDGFPEETNAPYGVAKKGLMLMGQGYRQQYGLNCITLIPTNMYGPNDNFHPHTSHVIPAIINKAAECRKTGSGIIKLWGSGKASREFLYVAECARAIRLAMENYDGAEPVNIGSGEEIFIHDLAERICSTLGMKCCDYDIIYDTNKPDGQPRRCLNIQKANTGFGFLNKVSLNQGLNKTVDWWRKHIRG